MEGEHVVRMLDQRRRIQKRFVGEQGSNRFQIKKKVDFDTTYTTMRQSPPFDPPLIAILPAAAILDVTRYCLVPVSDVFCQQILRLRSGDKVLETVNLSLLRTSQVPFFTVFVSTS